MRRNASGSRRPVAPELDRARRERVGRGMPARDRGRRRLDHRQRAEHPAATRAARSAIDAAVGVAAEVVAGLELAPRATARAPRSRPARPAGRVGSRAGSRTTSVVAFGQRPLGAPRHRAVRDASRGRGRDAPSARSYKVGRISSNQAVFACHKLCVCSPRRMEPPPTPDLSLAAAGSVLIGATAAVIVARAS